LLSLRNRIPLALVPLLVLAGCGGGDTTAGESGEQAAADAAVAYHQALADGDYDTVCSMQTRSRLKERAAQSGKGGDPTEICVKYFEENPDLQKSAAAGEFTVEQTTLEPRVISLADVNVADGEGAVSPVPMRLHGEKWQVDGEPGAAGFSGAGEPTKGDDAQIEAATGAYEDFRKTLADEDYLSACDLLSKRYRLVRAKSLDKAGVVGALCASSYEQDPAQAKAAAEPYEVTGVDLKQLIVPSARLSVTLAGKDGIWFMRFEDDEWRFAGGGLVDPNAGGSTTDAAEPDSKK
jgi:hypothetical protein